MPLSVATSAFNAPTVTGNQAVTGVGFQPLVVFFLYGQHGTALGNAVDAYSGFGAGVSSTSRRTVGGYTQDGVATSQAGAWHRSNRCIREVRTSDDALLRDADVVSLDTDGFTLNWLTVEGTARRIFYVALAGTDLTNVFIGNDTSGAVTGNKAVTGVGFQPDLLIALLDTSSTATDNENSLNGGWSFGVAKSSTSRWCTNWFSTDGAAAADEQRVLFTTRMAAHIRPDLTFRHEFDLVSFDSDGFTYNRITNAVDTIWYYIALKGTYQSFLSTFAQPGSTGNQGVTGVGFTPGLELFSSVSHQTSGTAQTGTAHLLGASLSSANRRVLTMAATDTADPTAADKRASEALCLTHLTAGTPTVNAEADFVSQDADGFTVNWTTADATARIQAYLALASAAGAADVYSGRGVARGIGRGVYR